MEVKVNVIVLESTKITLQLLKKMKVKNIVRSAAAALDLSGAVKYCDDGDESGKAEAKKSRENKKDLLTIQHMLYII